MNKQTARTALKTKRSELSSAYTQAASNCISASVIRLTKGKGVAAIMLYRSLSGEVDIDSAADELREGGVTVLLPKVDGDLMRACVYEGEGSLRKGAFGIMEPAGPEYEGEIDMIVVPGLAFDSCGRRIGYGKGYYDRFLPTAPHSLKVGVCFDAMILDEVPTEPHDVRMDVVITETKTCTI